MAALYENAGKNRRCNIHEYCARASITQASSGNNYISALTKAGLINVVVDDGISYYYATPRSEEYADRSKGELKKFIRSCLSTIIEADAKGVTEAGIKHYPYGISSYLVLMEKVIPQYFMLRIEIWKEML